MEAQRERIITDLLDYEKEEAELIKLYKILADQEIVGCLSQEKQSEYKENLEKLHFESLKHLGVIIDLLKKYKK